MRTRFLPSLIIIPMILSSCAGINSEGETSDTASSQSSESAVLTNNVSYTGILSAKSDSEQIGTHRLTMSNSSIVYLESNDSNLNLDSYVSKTVEVRGAAEPVGVQNETLLHVQEITVLVDSSAQSSAPDEAKSFCGGIAGVQCADGFVCTDDLTDDCDPQNGGADCSGVCVASTKTESSSSISDIAKPIESSSSSSSKPSTPISSTPSSSSSSESSSLRSSTSTILSDEAALMGKQIYDQANLWTQKYCTGHIAFCIAAHKNWYFKSFGATTSSLWHVEFGMSEITSLGNSPIVLKLLPGTSASVGGTSGKVLDSNGESIGFFDWPDGHFEVSGPQILHAAISYMLTTISPYNPGE